VENEPGSVSATASPSVSSLAFKRDPATRRVLSRQSIAGSLIAPFVRLIYDESRTGDIKPRRVGE